MQVPWRLWFVHTPYMLVEDAYLQRSWGYIKGPI